MKRFLFSTAALVIVGLSLGASPAHAGHWAVTLAGSCSGDENTYVFANNGPGNPYPYEGTTLTFTSLTVSGSSYAQGEQVTNQYMNDRQAAGTLGVQATFTWTHDSPGDSSTPPSTVNVLESGYANSGGLDSGQGDSELMQAYDGFTYTYSGYPGMSFQDPCQYTNINSGYPFRLSTTTSQGSYVTTNISIPSGTTSFTLPARTVGLGLLSNVGPTESGPGGAMSYTASLDTAADFTVSVAAASTSIGTSTTATVTVQSVNGFAGTVALSLVGQPTGAVPTLPGSGSTYQQALPYSLINGTSAAIDNPTGGTSGGGSVEYGPTDAQEFAGVGGTFSPTSVTLTSGGSATTTLTLTSTAGATGTYPIQVQGVYTPGSGSAITRDGFNTLNLH